MNQTVVLYDSTFDICFGYKRKYRDMIFCDLNFFNEIFYSDQFGLVKGNNS